MAKNRGRIAKNKRPGPDRPHARARAATGPPPSARTRLQKYLSDAGVASRRHAEELILAGRVLVNDQVVDELPAFVSPESDRVVVDGTVVRPQRPQYVLLHKPKNVVCTNRDPAGRLRAVDLLPDPHARLFPVGRLDADSTGLLLMTNDGELAQRLTHPRYGVPKTYRAEVRGRVPTDLPERMKAGVHLSEGKARANDVRIVRTAQDRSVLLITLREARHRQVRRMLARLGYPVRSLQRVQLGPLLIKGLPVGASRYLTPREITTLQAAIREADTRATGRARKRRRPADGAAKPPGARPPAPSSDARPPPGRRLIT